MKKDLKEEVFYDDPTRKNLLRLNTIQTINETFSLFTSGIEKLQELSGSLVLDKKLKKEIKHSLEVIVNELIKLHSFLKYFVETTKEEDITSIDDLIRKFDSKNGPISLNETTYVKIQSTIERIKEINKKINYEHKSK